jgi:hypothetical protein
MNTRTESSAAPRTPSNGRAAHATADMPHGLDELLALDAPALEALYCAASVPALADLSGDLRGRLLAWPALPGTVGDLVRALAGSARFPWRGKSFRPADAGAGAGSNRLFGDRLKLFRFTTAIGPSRAGAFDAVQLDYDHRGNPFFIRAIKDEVRQLRPGLYLGQGYVQLRGSAHLVLYFGLQA